MFNYFTRKPYGFIQNYNTKLSMYRIIYASNSVQIRPLPNDELDLSYCLDDKQKINVSKFIIIIINLTWKIFPLKKTKKKTG